MAGRGVEKEGVGGGDEDVTSCVCSWGDGGEREDIRRVITVRPRHSEEEAEVEEEKEGDAAWNDVEGMTVHRGGAQGRCELNVKFKKSLRILALSCASNARVIEVCDGSGGYIGSGRAPMAGGGGGGGGAGGGGGGGEGSARRRANISVDARQGGMTPTASSLLIRLSPGKVSGVEMDEVEVCGISISVLETEGGDGVGEGKREGVQGGNSLDMDEVQRMVKAVRPGALHADAQQIMDKLTECGGRTMDVNSIMGTVAGASGGGGSFGAGVSMLAMLAAQRGGGGGGMMGAAMAGMAAGAMPQTRGMGRGGEGELVDGIGGERVDAATHSAVVDAGSGGRNGGGCVGDGGAKCEVCGGRVGRRAPDQDSRPESVEERFGERMAALEHKVMESMADVEKTMSEKLDAAEKRLGDKMDAILEMLAGLSHAT